MFIDIAKVTVKAGDGGNGIVSFRHEIYVDKGGPDGGDGGDGGDIIFMSTFQENTLVNFRFHKEIKGEDGKPGAGQRKHGRSGKPSIIRVPVGTQISHISGEILADFTEDGQQVVIAKGGKGGFGNAHFTSSTRQTPRIAEKGEPGEEFELVLELKMIADVGLVGLPNAGKSTLLSVITNARPEIADYPFTTIRPNLGVADIDSTSLLFADIPGLIEGASQGKGLGDEFLRHVERTKVLVHLIDTYNENIVEAYNTIQKELKEYKVDLSKLPQVIALTKTEGLDDEMTDDLKSELNKVIPKNTKVFAISSSANKGIKELLREVAKLSAKESSKQAKIKENTRPVIRLGVESTWYVEEAEDRFIVHGDKVERFALRTDFEDFFGVQRLRDILRKNGILTELEKRKIEPGQIIQIGDNPQQYIEY